MVGIHRPAAGLAAVVLLGIAGSAAGGESYRNAKYKYAIDLPEGWEVKPWEQFTYTFTPDRKATKTDTSIDDRGAFLAPAGAAKGKLPSAHIGAIPHDRPEITFADFEKVMTQIFTARDRYGRTDLRTPLAFDEQKKRMVVQINDGERVGYGVGFFGKTEMVLLVCLADRKTYPEHLPMFEKMVDSFRFDGDPALTSAGEPPYLDKLLKTNLGPAGQMAVVGGGVTVVVLLVGLVFLRDKPDRRGHHGF